MPVVPFRKRRNRGGEQGKPLEMLSIRKHTSQKTLPMPKMFPSNVDFRLVQWAGLIIFFLNFFFPTLQGEGKVRWLKDEEIRNAASCALVMGVGCCGFFLDLFVCFGVGFFPYIKLANYLSGSNHFLLGDLTPVTAADTDLSCQEQL